MARVKLAVPWDDIQRLYESGSTPKEIGKMYSVRPGSISHKASKEKWLSPMRVNREVEKVREVQREASGVRAPVIKSRARIQEDRKEVLEDESFGNARAAMNRFWQGKPTPTSFKEAKIAHAIAVDSLPKDREVGASVQVNVGILSSQGKTQVRYRNRPTDV